MDRRLIWAFIFSGFLPLGSVAGAQQGPKGSRIGYFSLLSPPRIGRVWTPFCKECVNSALDGQLEGFLQTCWRADRVTRSQRTEEPQQEQGAEITVRGNPHE